MYKTNTKGWKVNTPHGYKHFKGISKDVKSCTSISTLTYSLSASSDSHFICTSLENDTYEVISDLQIGDKIYTELGLEVIVDKQDIGLHAVYDLVEVEDVHVFYTNGILSHNCRFLDSGDAAIDDATFKRMMSECMEPDTCIDEGRYKIWEDPDPEKLYVAGVDVSEGINQDASVINILDITDLREIKQVAEWYSNSISPAEFATKCKEILDNWGQPLALIERNNQGGQVIDRLVNDMNYPNIVSYGGGKDVKRIRQLAGMISHTNTKYTAVMNQRYFINQIGAVTIRDIETLKEFQTFIKQPNGTWRAKNGRKDDKVMSITWALMILEKAITEKYFEIEETDEFGKPLKITRMDFGIKYYANPTSIYNSEESGLNSNTIAPIMFGWGLEDDDPDMKEFANYLAEM